MNVQKILILFLTLVILFISCERDKDVDLTTVLVVNEHIAPSYTSAEVQCSFQTEATLRNAYLQYSSTSDFSEYEEIAMWENNGGYHTYVEDLQDNTIYYIRYVVSNRYSSVLVDDISRFQTLEPSAPTIKIDSIGDLWDTHAKAYVTMAFDGGAPISKMGICWSTQFNVSIQDNKKESETKTYIFDITSLQPNTTYYVRAYAENKKGISYSEEESFVTFALPQVQTGDITDIQPTTVSISGTLLFNGNDIATIVGYCWSEKNNPTTSSNHHEVSLEGNMLNCRLSNLKDETLYYIRSYAKNKIGTTYGAEKSFTTEKAYLPSIKTTNIFDIGYTNVMVEGNIIDNGGAEVIERGVCFSTLANPTINGDDCYTEQCGKGVGKFVCELKNLKDNTKYYARTYAINIKGVAYGDEVTFTTKERLYIDGYEYVDLGLPSGTLWATHNIGATTPEGYGDYFAWGETEPKRFYVWERYKYCEGTEKTLTKYCTNSEYGRVDHKQILEPMDDAAQVNWGGRWKVPSEADADELLENCIWTWDTINNISGCKVQGKNGNYIFLPAAGSSWNPNSYFVMGEYWCNSILSRGNISDESYEGIPNNAFIFKIVERDYSSYGSFLSRENGCTIRPVCVP